jgi:CBS domain-containing protein
MIGWKQSVAPASADRPGPSPGFHDCVARRNALIFTAGGVPMLRVKYLLAFKDKNVWSIGPDEAVLEAIRQMAEKRIGALLVMQGDALVGIISERDYARKVILMGRSSSETPVSQVMSSPVTTVSPDDAVHRCMELMTEQRIRHLPVVEKGKLIGIISIGDLVKAVIEEQQQTIDHLERYIAG